MSKIKIPVIIDGYELVEDMAKAVLNYTYKGKTLKEWADSISSQRNNADCIRAMSDDEMVELFIHNDTFFCPKSKTDIDYCKKAMFVDGCRNCFANWLKQECE